ncbi:MAG: ribosome biogenesis GTP-binding protein YihA/YsxC [Patescibacteria group bacterium]|nr:MAG: ribosome biogenesis GTP-binding protein YihA/YsxC [Patescibacteria group bacterium]
MEINTAEFVKGILGTDEITEDGVPQIAFVGRSNVGKSSVINSLLGRKNLVKSSSVPGKTREINFFLVHYNDGEASKEIYFVDLPGYGFAKLPAKVREKLRKLMYWYLADLYTRPRAVVLIVDVRVGPSALDREMLELLKEHGHRVVVVANKADKLKKSERERRLMRVEEGLGCRDIILYSAKTKVGREKLLKEVLG